MMNIQLTASTNVQRASRTCGSEDQEISNFDLLLDSAGYRNSSHTKHLSANLLIRTILHMAVAVITIRRWGVYWGVSNCAA